MCNIFITILSIIFAFYCGYNLNVIIEKDYNFESFFQNVFINAYNKNMDIIVPYTQCSSQECIKLMCDFSNNLSVSIIGIFNIHTCSVSSDIYLDIPFWISVFGTFILITFQIILYCYSKKR